MYTFPIFYSCYDLANSTGQTYTSGTTSAVSQSGGSLVGTWSNGLSISNIDNHFIIMPHYGIVAYSGTSFGGSILLDFKNNTSNPITCKCSGDDNVESLYLYFNNYIYWSK